MVLYVVNSLTIVCVVLIVSSGLVKIVENKSNYNNYQITKLQKTNCHPKIHKSHAISLSKIMLSIVVNIPCECRSLVLPNVTQVIEKHGLYPFEFTIICNGGKNGKKMNPHHSHSLCHIDYCIFL